MPDDLSVAVDKLRTSTQRLNTICDAAAQVVREVEAFLEECHVGIPGWVKIKDVSDSDDPPDIGYSVCLEYRRIPSGKYRIAVVTTPYSGDPEGESVRPWSDCTRDEKLESFEKLPELLVELANRVDARAVKAEQTMTAVGTLLQSVKKRKGG